VEEARKNSWPEEEGYSQTVLAVALLSQGQTQEARKALDSGASLLRNTENFRRRSSLTTTTASVLAATGHAPEALRILDAALADVRKAGHSVMEFRVRLTICEVLLWSGNDAGARDALSSLERDARAEGMLLFAQRAQSLM
jgi:ATP/maltotriose-dependent transcriptional regulator MalT